MIEFHELYASLQPTDTLYFLDETAIELNRRLGRMWWVKGERPHILIDGGRARLNVIGAIDMMTYQGIFAEIERLDSSNFQQFLIHLINNTPLPGKIYIVLDNARAHHAKVLTLFLESMADRLELVFLPPYSPDLNPIELLWRDMKREVNTNMYYETLDDLRMAWLTYINEISISSPKIASLWNPNKYLGTMTA